MKTFQHNNKVIKLVLLFLAFIFGIESMVNAQDQKIRINLSYHEIDGTKLLKAKVITKEGRVYIPVVNVDVNFFNKKGFDQYALGKIATNDKGIAELLLKADPEMSEDSTYYYLASVINNPIFKDKTDDIAIKQVDYIAKYEVIDSVNTVKVAITDMAGLPVAKLPIKTYVKRLFGKLPIGEGNMVTNKEGKLEITIPNDIPGNEKGMIDLIVSLEDHDDFGNLELNKKIDWGVPIVIKSLETERELWSVRANAPVYLIVVTNSIIFGIWFVIFYISYQIFRLKKIGKHLN